MTSELLMRLVSPFIDIAQAIHALRALPRFIRLYNAYRRASREEMSFLDLYPCLGDISDLNPVAPYMYESVWAASEILARSPRPPYHVDVGSQVFFVLMLATNLKVVFVDVRRCDNQLVNMDFVQGSLISLPFASNSIPSLSCLSVAEHIGLGRYDDGIDWAGTKRAADELSRVLAPRGMLYFSVPIGRSRVFFNAHRVHPITEILAMFSSLKLLDFSSVDAAGRFRTKTPIDTVRDDQDCPSGMFLFTKPQ